MATFINTIWLTNALESLQRAVNHRRELPSGDMKYKKFALMLTKCAKAYSSSCSQIVLVCLQPFRCNSLLKCAPQLNIAKINKTSYFESSRSFRVIDADMTEKLVTSACCDRQHIRAYLQPFARKAGQQW